MKNLFGSLLIVLFLCACGKDANRRSGVCYCEFFSGKEQEYDLSHLTRQQQIDQCNTHNTNAGNFGGKCELE